MKFIEIIGIMSGSSLDGIDLVHCTFSTEEGRWTYQVNATHTVPYTPYWQEQLTNAKHLSAYQIQRLDVEYGALLGELVHEFKQEHGLKADLIAAHGHTLFHDPDKRISKQLGDASAIWSVTETPVVTDFRQGDVLLGGQGAPLAPVGDWWLFPDYPVCLNLGGIANVSIKNLIQEYISAFDVAPCNLILNALAREKGETFDQKGQLAKKGEVDTLTLDTLNQLPFYQKQGPKSLDKEAVYETYWPLIREAGLSVEDQLATFTEHVAQQVGQAINQDTQWRGSSEPHLLITGGGAYNDWLIERIAAHADLKIKLPGNSQIQYKEALIFAFMGLLRCDNRVNCLQKVTGARESHSAGKLYGDFSGIKSKL